MSERLAPRVGIVMGSESDLDVLQEAARMLEALGVGYEATVASAHRTPERARRWIYDATARGVRVFIAGAGGAAALPGFVASETTLPVIGVPIPSVLDGLDSLLSMVQMPKGVPVATVAIGKPGAANAGILAAQILAVSDAGLAQRLAAHRAEMAREVEARDRKVQEALRPREETGRSGPPLPPPQAATGQRPSDQNRPISGGGGPKAEGRRETGWAGGPERVQDG